MNDLYSTQYREPYAGGGGLALTLLFTGFVPSIHLNDSDPALFAFWRAVLDRNREFCELVDNARLTVDEWYRQRQIWLSSSSTELELGFATYYLNRTNRSGIIEGAGPIGGYDQSGNYKIDARFNKSAQLTLLRRLGEARELISVSCMDALDYVRLYGDRPDLLYLDPPYYVKGRKLYRNFYDHDDHSAIARVMKSIEAKWVVTYDDVTPIRTLYSWQEPIAFQLGYSAGPRSIGSEVMYLSANLTRPAVSQLAA
jgi:DNA adenine methylase